MKLIKIKTPKGYRMLSQRKAAEQLGISESYLCLLMAKKRKPSIKVYFALKGAGINLWSGK
jgi:transcriptional regulator with XRE-family HTH domain